jgi:hypothetical protein
MNRATVHCLLFHPRYDDKRGYVACLAFERTEDDCPDIPAATRRKFEVACENALSVCQRTLRFLDMPTFGFTCGYETSSWSKQARQSNRRETIDGASAGLAAYLAAFSLSTGIRLRPDFVVSAALETTGTVDAVECVPEKLTATPAEAATVILSARLSSAGKEREHRARIGNRLICLSDVSDLFVRETFERIFVFSDLLAFIVGHEFLTDDIPAADPSLPGAHAFRHLLDTVKRGFWYEVSKSFDRPEPPFDLDTPEGHQRAIDQLALFCEQHDIVNLAECAQVLAHHHSSESFIASLGNHLLNGVVHSLSDSWESVRRRCDDEYEHWLAAHQASTTTKEKLQAALRIYTPLHGHIGGLLFLVRCMADLDLKLGREIMSRLPIFGMVERGYEEAWRATQVENPPFPAKLAATVLHHPAHDIARLKQHYWRTLRRTADGGEDFEPVAPAMEVVVSDGLHTLEFRLNESTIRDRVPRWVAEELRIDLPPKGGDVVQEPRLLWQESANLPHYWQPEQFSVKRCAIASLPDGDLVSRLFSDCSMDIVAQGPGGTDVRVLWANEYKWPPSIDSLWFASLLRRQCVDKEAFRTVLDVGAGTGFLGIALATMNKNVSTLCCSDESSLLKSLCTFNVRRALGERLGTGLEYHFITARGLPQWKRWIREKNKGMKFDVLVSSPPYLPRVEEYNISQSLMVAVNGTTLLEEIASGAGELCRQAFVQFSEIAKPEFDAALKKGGGEATLLGTFEVPVRIQSIMPVHPEKDEKLSRDDAPSRYDHAVLDFETKQRYAEFLKTRGMYEPGQDNRNFRFWHRLLAYSITWPSKAGSQP